MPCGLVDTHQCFQELNYNLNILYHKNIINYDDNFTVLITILPEHTLFLNHKNYLT